MKAICLKFESEKLCRLMSRNIRDGKIKTDKNSVYDVNKAENMMVERMWWTPLLIIFLICFMIGCLFWVMNLFLYAVILMCAGVVPIVIPHIQDMFNRLYPFYVIKWDSAIPMKIERDGFKHYSPQTYKNMLENNVLKDLMRLQIAGKEQIIMYIVLGGVIGFLLHMAVMTL